METDELIRNACFRIMNAFSLKWVREKDNSTSQVYNGNIRIICDICSNLTIKTTKRRH